MKAKYILSGLLMVALVIGGMGYDVAAKAGDKVRDKVTGGGTFINEGPPDGQYVDYLDKISFGFNGQAKNGVVKGQFQLTNQNTGKEMHGTFGTYVVTNPYWVEFAGECSINGTNESFRVKIITGGSTERIWIWIGSEPHIYGEIEKGNITRHEKNKK